MAPVKRKANADSTSKGKGKAKAKTMPSAGVQPTPTPPTRQTRQARQTQLAQQIQQSQRPPGPTTRTEFESIQPMQRMQSSQRTSFPNLMTEPVQLQNMQSFLPPQPLQQMQYLPNQPIQSFQQPWDLQSPTFSSSQDMPPFQQLGSFGPFDGMQQQPQQTPYQSMLGLEGMQPPQQMPYQSMQSFQGTHQPQQNQYGSNPFLQGSQQPQQTQQLSGFYFDQPQQMQPQLMQPQSGFHFEQPQQMQPQQMPPQSFPFLQQSPFMQQQPYSPIQQPYSPMQQFPQRQSQLFPAFEQIQQPLLPLQQQSPPIFQGGFGQLRRPQPSRRPASAFVNLADEEDDEEEAEEDEEIKRNDDDYEAEEEEEPPKRPVRNKRLTQTSTGRHTTLQSGESSQRRGFTSNQSETQATKKKKEAGQKRKAEGNGEESRPKKKKMGRPANERNGRCDHCFENNIPGCDWQTKKLTGPMECTQCSEFRLSSGNIHHTCTAPGYGDGLYRDYSSKHPMEYPDMTCVACEKMKRHGKCDIDMLLGYACTWANRRAGACKIPGFDTGFARRPGNAAQVKRWFRRACDSCHSRALTAPQSSVPCSWLKSRDRFGSACNECKQMGLACFDGGNIVEEPSADVIQNNHSNIDQWNYEFFGHREGFIEVSRNTRGRYVCQQCDEDGTHCRISPRRPFASCSRCSTMGIDCVEKTARGKQPREFPIHSLATVGFGTVAPFNACHRCIEMGRNCDRQRPCDSCLHNDERDLCDIIRSKGAIAANGQVAGKKNVFRGRLPNPGPLYYLALGYGPNGVNDRKDGSQLEHWYGPFGPIYARASLEFTPNGHAFDMQNKRLVLRPPGAPPQGLTTADMPSKLTVERLRQLIITAWPNAITMNQHQYWHIYAGPEAWAECVAAAKRRDTEAQQRAAGKTDGRPKKKSKKRAGGDEDGEDGDDENEDAEDEDGEGEEVVSSLPLLGGDAIDPNTQAGTEAPFFGNDVGLENYEFFTAFTAAGIDAGQGSAPDANGDEDVDMMG